MGQPAPVAFATRLLKAFSGTVEAKPDRLQLPLLDNHRPTFLLPAPCVADTASETALTCPRRLTGQRAERFHCQNRDGDVRVVRDNDQLEHWDKDFVDPDYEEGSQEYVQRSWG